MVDATHISYPANDRSYFSLLKKDIRQKVQEAGINQEKQNAIDIIVSEMTSNLLKYASDGEILLGVFKNENGPYIELICIDNGPGMQNPKRMVQDGVSTSATLGHGLGSIKRLSNFFDIYSQVGSGTVVLSRVCNNPKIALGYKNILFHPLVVAKPGEEVSGDGFSYKLSSKYAKFMLADGLGHGPEANYAVNQATKAFKVFPDYNPVETLRFIHYEIRKTRGAVINILGYNFETGIWSTVGIGNISLRMCGNKGVKNHMSYNGIVGHNIPNTMNEQCYGSDLFDHVIICSDGIKTRWDLLKYPQINKHDPVVLAAVLYRDQARKTDDMSVVSIKIK